LSKIFYKLLRKLLFGLIAKKKKEYDRFLSIPDYLIDRWERAKLMGFGEGSSVYDSCLVLGDVKVGKNVWIGPYTILDGSGGLTIGDNCQIGPGVKIYSHDTLKKLMNENAESEKSSVIIGNNVAVGSNTVVSMGVNIGEYVIIAPNSYVIKDIPSYSKVYGNPARVFDKVEKQ
jgi:acetyltransferase-like isoleucine patch superfamily enzyme